MEAVKRMYLKGLDAIGEMPSWSRDWRWIALTVSVYTQLFSLSD